MDIRVLIIDDEKDICNLIAEFLKEFKYSSDTVYTVKDAFEKIDQNEYHIIITDKNMPGPNGSEEAGMDVLKYAKVHQPAAKVVMMTGYATIETAIRAMKLGAFDYLTKPIRLQDLREKIERIYEFGTFLNPDTTDKLHKDMNREILDFIEKRNGYLDDEELHAIIKSINKKIDAFFDAQRQAERMIILQKETLDKIAYHVEELTEICSEDNPARMLIEKIRDEVKKRF